MKNTPFKYTITGTPIPLARHRSSGKRMYNPQYALRIHTQTELRSQHIFGWTLKGPLKLEVVFHMPIPSSLSGIKKKKLPGTPHYSKPDISNLIKFIEDAAAGVIIEDDRLIVEIHARKIYSDNPRTELTFTEL